MQNLQPNNVVSDKTSFFVIDPFGTSHCAFHLVEIFAVKEWKLKRSILNRLWYQAVNCEIKRSNCFYNSLLKHFSYVTFLRTTIIHANKIPFTRYQLL